MTSSPEGKIEVLDDAHAVARRAAEWFAQTVIAAPGNLRIALSGGSTPKELYARLGSEPFLDRTPWERLELFWGDERFVPADDPASNYGMARTTLLGHAPIVADRVHPMPVDGTPADAARRYEAILKRCYGAEQLDASHALFEIVFLGLGSDGHTASLIPGQPVLDEREHWVAAVTAGRSEPRITLTYPAIESSNSIVFLVTGAEKAGAVRATRAGDQNLPAARLRPRGQVLWFVDRAAAGLT
ncbi:MAG TPA: 6-phosphogluconolactonase [Rhizomicrobium sp.]|jgi:6-phosphogluconolactonase